MAYIITILGATVTIALLNFLYDGVYSFAAFGTLLFFTCLGVVAVIAIDGVLAFVIRRMPERWFAPGKRFFAVPKWEKNLYRKLKINKWKKYVPELGCFTGFHKDKLQNTGDSAYLRRFLLESNYGSLGHIAGAVFGFAILWLPFLRPLSMGLPIAIVNFILSMLPTCILRANTPALTRLWQKAKAREQKETGT